jgi:hypothetical protein
VADNRRAKMSGFGTRTAKFALGLFLVSGSVSAWAQEIRAKQEEESTIRVVSEGRFETTFTKRSGFGTTWFDLKNDPGKRRDLGPRVGGEYGGGLLWVKIGVKERDGSFEPTPIEELKLLEAGPARVRVELRGVHNRYGVPGPGRALAALRFTMVYTLYPDGNVAIGYALEASQDVPIPGFLIITRSTGAWGPSGKGEGKGEVHAAAEFGDEKPSGKTASSFTLQWSDGPTHFTDMLMVAHRGRYNGSYWHEGYLDQDYRTALNLRSGQGFFQEDALRKGTTRLSVLMRFANDMNSGKEAARYANDYQSPDRLEVGKGQADASDEGDRDQDGFNEEEGCYVLKAAPDGVAFTLHGSKVARMNPAFKVKGWKGSGTPRLTVGGKPLVQGADFQASCDGGVLLLKLARIVNGDVPVSISAQ